MDDHISMIDHNAAVQAAVAKAVEACAAVADAEGGWPENTESAPTDFSNEGRNAASKCIAAAIRARKGYAL